MWNWKKHYLEILKWKWQFVAYLKLFPEMETFSEEDVESTAQVITTSSVTVMSLVVETDDSHCFFVAHYKINFVNPILKKKIFLH